MRDRRAVHAAAAAAACAVLAHAGAQVLSDRCLPQYMCQYVFTNDMGVQFQYDFSSLCRNDEDYYINDTQSHDYWLNICGVTKHSCIPKGYDVVYQYGVGIQMWGGTPNCTQKCSDAITGDPVCCTANCEVIGVGAPTFNVLDNQQPGMGVRMTHRGVSAAPGDPNECPFNPSTGAFYERTVIYDIFCDSSVDGVRVDEVVFNQTDKCEYNLAMTSNQACACVPNCEGKVCGGDQCGGSCGECGVNEICQPGSQTCCARQCDNKNCGDDGCGGNCGACPSGQECDATKHQCFPSNFKPNTNPNLPGSPSHAGEWAGYFFFGVIMTLAGVGAAFYVKTRGIPCKRGGAAGAGDRYGSSAAASLARPAGQYGTLTVE